MILKYNAKHTLEPRRAYDYVFVEGYSEKVYNQEHIVKRLKFNGQTTYYFENSTYLFNYLTKYVENNATLLCNK